MKKVYAVFAGVLLFAAALAVFACFDEDPMSKLGNEETTIVGDDGSSTDTQHPGTPWKGPVPVGEHNEDYANVVEVSFPLTINVAFSGFLDSDNPSQEPITRMCMLYFSKSGVWEILHDVKNPQFPVVGEESEKRAIFGRYTIPDSLGFNPGEYLAVLFYFESATHKSFELDSLVGSKTKANHSALVLVPSGNTNPW